MRCTAIYTFCSLYIPVKRNGCVLFENAAFPLVLMQIYLIASKRVERRGANVVERDRPRLKPGWHPRRHRYDMPPVEFIEFRKARPLRPVL